MYVPLCINQAPSKLIVAVAILLQLPVIASANPAGQAVVEGSGSATFSESRGLLEVKASNGTIINWKSFSIDPEETTRFAISNSGRVLNRVSGSDVSNLLGNLSSDGTLYLINPNGIVVGQGASIDSRGLVLSTLGLTNEEFRAGTDRFTGGGGKLINGGTITAKESVALIGPSITNRGALQTGSGDIILASGDTVTMASQDIDFVTFEVPGNIENVGNLVASNGAVGVFAANIEARSGLLEARGISSDGNGSIKLTAMDSVNLAGDVKADSGITIKASDVVIGGGDAAVETRDLAIDATDTVAVLSAVGTETRITTTGDMSIVSASLNIESSGDMSIDSAGRIRTITSGQTRFATNDGASLGLTGESLDASAQTIRVEAEPGAPIRLTATNDLNLAGTTSIQVTGDQSDIQLASVSGNVDVDSPICVGCDAIAPVDPDPVIPDPVIPDPVIPDPVIPDPVNPVDSGNPIIPQAPAPTGLVVRPDTVAPLGVIVTASTSAVVNTLETTPGVGHTAASIEDDGATDEAVGSDGSVAEAIRDSRVNTTQRSSDLPQCN